MQWSARRMPRGRIAGRNPLVMRFHEWSDGGYNPPMARRLSSSGLLSAAARLLPLVALGALSGCASSNLYWGPGLSTCGGPHAVANFASGACRNGAEYDIARKKAKRSLAEAALGHDAR